MRNTYAILLQVDSNEQKCLYVYIHFTRYYMWYMLFAYFECLSECVFFPAYLKFAYLIESNYSSILNAKDW